MCQQKLVIMNNAVPKKFVVKLVKNTIIMNAQLLIDAKKLPVLERINLVEAIWDTIIPNEPEIPLTNAQKSLLDERLAEYEANPMEGSSWEDVKTRLEKRI